MRALTRPWLLGLLLVALSLAVFLPGLPGGFFFDDYPNIVTNPLVHAQELNAESLSRAWRAYQPGMWGRPLATLSFALDYYLWGKQPFGFKLTSLLVHGLNTLLVFALFSVLLKDRVAECHRRLLAALAGFVWATHPLQVSTVLYIVQRMETMAATFVLLALLSYLKGRRRQIAGQPGWGHLVGAGLLTGLGLLAKETAVLVIPLALSLELTVLGFRASESRTGKLLRIGYALTLLAGLALFLAMYSSSLFSGEPFAGRSFSALERLLTQARVLWLYVGQILLPMPDSLVVYYDNYPKSSALFTPWTTAIAIAGWTAALGVAWRLRRQAPLAALGVFWFLAAHSLTSAPIALELVFEHRNYLALVGPVLLAIDLLVRLPTRDGPRIKVVGGLAVIVSFAFLAAIRAGTWGAPLLLASDLVARNPGSARASNDLATIYLDFSGGDPDSPFFQFAVREFERGSKLPGSSPLPEQGLLLAAAVTGVPTKDEWWDSLIHKVRNDPVSPEMVMAVTGLLKQHHAGHRLDVDRLAEAYQQLMDRQKRWPGPFTAQFADFVLDELGDTGRARALYLKAVRDNPDDAAFANRLLGLLIQDDKPELAAVVAEEMVRLGILHATPATQDP